MNICLRGVTSPTLARGIPCPTLILVDPCRGVRIPTLIYKSARTCGLHYIVAKSVKRCKKANAHDISSSLGLKRTKNCPIFF